jgi:hypothetical protein
MDSKLDRQRERRAKVKAEWAVYDNTPERKAEKRELNILIKKEKKDRKDYLNKQYYKQHKKTTIKPLSVEQKQEVKNSLPGPMQKIICECGKIFTRKNKIQHLKSMFHRQYLEDSRFKQQEEKKQ